MIQFSSFVRTKYTCIGEIFSWVFNGRLSFHVLSGLCIFSYCQIFHWEFYGISKERLSFQLCQDFEYFHILVKKILGISLGFPNYDSLGFGDSLLLLLVACGSLIVFLLYSAVSWNRNRNWLISSFVHFLLFSFSLLPCSPVLQGH